MKKIIEFTKNWKYRNLLHIVGGFLMGVFLSLLFAWYVSLVLIITFANYWEYSQVKFYKTKYSISDILLTTLGCTIATIIMYLFFNIA
jgi:VanZ family protein